MKPGNEKFLVPPWEYAEPIWELRVGEYRVFYDVDMNTPIVIVRAIRHKPPHKAVRLIGVRGLVGDYV